MRLEVRLLPPLLSRSSVAQWQCGALLRRWLQVRLLPGELFGLVAKRQGTRLQPAHRRFDPAPDLREPAHRACADVTRTASSSNWPGGWFLKPAMRVRVPLRSPTTCLNTHASGCGEVASRSAGGRETAGSSPAFPTGESPAERTLHAMKSRFESEASRKGRWPNGKAIDYGSIKTHWWFPHSDSLLLFLAHSSTVEPSHNFSRATRVRLSLDQLGYRSVAKWYRASFGTRRSLVRSQSLRPENPADRTSHAHGILVRVQDDPTGAVSLMERHVTVNHNNPHGSVTRVLLWVHSSTAEPSPDKRETRVRVSLDPRAHGGRSVPVARQVVILEEWVRLPSFTPRRGAGRDLSGS